MVSALLRFSIAIVALTAVEASAAIRPTVAVLKSSSITPFEQATAKIVETLARDPLQPEILTFDLEGDAAKGPAVLARIHASGASLLISVGSLATSVALDDPAPLPTIFSMVLYPAQSGFLSRKGLSVTGASLDVPPEVPFAYLRRLVPSLRRIGVLYNPAETGTVIEEARTAARDQGLELVAEPVEEPASAIAALDRIATRVDAVWSVADSHVFGPSTGSALILGALRHRIPLFGLSPSQVRAGAIAAVTCDSEDVGRQTAELAARALHGSKLSALTLTRPGRTGLVLNVRVAKNLGIEVPHDLEAEATEVMR